MKRTMTELIDELKKEEEVYDYLKSQFNELCADSSEYAKNAAILDRAMDSSKATIDALANDIKKNNRITFMSVVNLCRNGITEFDKERADARQALKLAADAYEVPLDNSMFETIYQNMISATKRMNQMLSSVISIVKDVAKGIYKGTISAVTNTITSARNFINDKFLDVRMFFIDRAIELKQEKKSEYVNGSKEQFLSKKCTEKIEANGEITTIWQDVDVLKYNNTIAGLTEQLVKNEHGSTVHNLEQTVNAAQAKIDAYTSFIASESNKAVILANKIAIGFQNHAKAKAEKAIDKADKEFNKLHEKMEKVTEKVDKLTSGIDKLEAKKEALNEKKSDYEAPDMTTPEEEYSDY